MKKKIKKQKARIISQDEMPQILDAHLVQYVKSKLDEAVNQLLEELRFVRLYPSFTARRKFQDSMYELYKAGML